MKGVLLVNLGSPDSPSPEDVKPYLDEFLMDERVMDVPKWWRKILVRRIILRKRPEASANAYRKIWWKEGSPLIVLSERFHKKVQEKSNIPVALGMRYGSMPIKNGLKELQEKGVTEVLLVPLYPHYAMSSFETVVVKAQEDGKKYFPDLKIDVLPPFYKNPDYIKVLADSIADSLKNFDYDHLLFSYHGIPERQILKTDPTKKHCKIDGNCCAVDSEAHKYCYRHQVFETTKLVLEQLGISQDKVSDSFQSRLGRTPWLKPYTDFEFERLAQQGIKNLAVVTPAFVADCLETLEEIAMEGKNQFQEAGGKDYLHIPCLNDNDEWVNVMVKWIADWERN